MPTPNEDAVVEQDVAEEPTSDLVEDFGTPDVTWVEDGEVVSDDEDEEVIVDDSEEEEPTAEEEEDVPAEEAEPEEIEGESTPEDEVEGSADAPTETDEPEAATETPAESLPAISEPEPVQFKADGKEFTVSARKDAEGNLIIAPDEWNRSVQPRLADRGAWQQERESLRRQVAALNPEQNPEVIRARQVMESFQALLDKGPDAVIEWAEDFDRNKEVLIARAEAAAARAEVERARGAQASTQQQEEQANLRAQMQQGLGTLLEQAAQVEEYKGLDMDYVRRVLEPMAPAIYFRAPYDMPEYGLQKGEIGVNLQVVENVLKAEADRNRSVQERLKAAEAASAAKRRNSAVLNDSPRKKAPPVATDKSAAGQGAVPAPKPKTREEWERNLAALARG